MSSWKVVKAVAKRDLTGYFRSPTGYVFITLFILMGAVAAFWQDRFFANNLANLDMLNAVFPYLLLFFIPAITMSVWAAERQQGTEALLLTLPAPDGAIIFGKYLACLGVYSLSLVFSLSHVAVLSWLGNPDPGLMGSTYTGYWLMGALLLGGGMIGSFLTQSLTVGFILGALGCAAMVFLDRIGLVTSDRFARWINRVSPLTWFEDATSGLASLSMWVNVGSGVGVLLAVMLVLVGRRLLRDRDFSRLMVHRWVRIAAIGVTALALTTVAGRVGGRGDWTAEGLHSLSVETRQVLASLKSDQPVYLQAFVSPDVPEQFVPVRSALLGLLRAYEAAAPDGVLLRIRETEPFSEAAREAREQFNITPQNVVSSKSGRTATQEVYLGLAAVSGAEEVVIPFFHKGLSVEYELTRAIRVASRPARLKLGVLNTDAKLFGGLDFASMSSARKWSVLEELAQQYEVIQLSPDTDYPREVNVLMVAMVSSLTQTQMDRLMVAIQWGVPALLFDDPLPLVDYGLIPGEPKGGRRGLMGGQSPSEPKGNAEAFYRKLGLRWPSTEVVWDSYNPHPPLAHLPPEVVFVGAKSGAKTPFHPEDPVSAGLQEVVLLFPGQLHALKAKGLEITPLLETTSKSGILPVQGVVQRGMFGVLGLNAQRAHQADGRAHLVAARVMGVPQRPQAGGSRADSAKRSDVGSRGVHVIVMADLDMISEEFFEIRRQGLENLEFDNVALVSNAVDVLAGEGALVGLRRKRKQHRTLEAVEALTRQHVERSQKEAEAAETRAKSRLLEAQESLNQKVAALRARTDLDDQTKAIMVASLEEVENRRLVVTKAAIEEDKKRAIESSQAETELAVRAIQRRIKVMAVALPPIPPLLLAAWVYWRKRKKEHEAIPAERYTS